MAQHYDIQNFRKDNPNFDKWFPKLEKSIQHWLNYLNSSHMKSYKSLHIVNKSVTIIKYIKAKENFIPVLWSSTV